MMQAFGWPTNCDQIRVTKMCMWREHDEVQFTASRPGALHCPPAEDELEASKLDDNCSPAVWMLEESGKQKN